eukprot:7186281-Ditylum_brightwellii.AAC.1
MVAPINVATPAAACINIATPAAARVGKVVTQSSKTENRVGRKGQKNMSVLGTTHFKQEIKNRNMG